MAKLIHIPIFVDDIQYVANCFIYEKENRVTVDVIKCNYQARCTKGVHCVGVCVAAAGTIDYRQYEALQAEALRLLPLHEVMES